MSFFFFESGNKNLVNACSHTSKSKGFEPFRTSLSVRAAPSSPRKVLSGAVAEKKEFTLHDPNDRLDICEK